MGPMIREHDAVRVNQWVEEAVNEGAELITGGERNGQIHTPIPSFQRKTGDENLI